MDKIKINCSTGQSLPLKDFEIFPVKLKSSSVLQIEELKDLILKDGFCFPIGVAKVNNKNYVIDGDVRLYALQELELRGFEIPEIPVYFIRASEEKVKRLILSSSSIFHIATKNAIIDFCKDMPDTDPKEFAFAEGELIDFYTVNDIDRYFEMAKTNKEKGLTGNENYFELFKDGVI